jgi:hypothetical protein
MKKSILCAFAFALPATALAQDKKPIANVTGFLALDVFKWVKKEGSREEMNIGIGTINVDARARNGGTSLKIKLDLDGALANRNAIFEEATITQEVADNLAFTAGKGVVPFHQKHYGVIKDSYVDGGTIIGNYYWNYGDQDRRYLVSMKTGGKYSPIQNHTTLFGDSSYQVIRENGAYKMNSKYKNAADSSKTTPVPTFSDQKGIDPRDQIGIANKTSISLGDAFSIACSGLYSWNRLDPHKNYAVATSGTYETSDFNAWYELQYGHSSSFQYSFENKNEITAQLGAEFYLTPSLSLLTNLETASFAFTEFRLNRARASDETSDKTLDFANAKQVGIDGVTSKIEIGAATHISEKATWTNGFMYEIGDVSEDDIKLTTGRTGQQFTSTFTFSF